MRFCWHKWSDWANSDHLRVATVDGWMRVAFPQQERTCARCKKRQVEDL